MTEDNPYAAPNAEIDEFFDYGFVQLAGRGTRFVAFILDSLISMIWSMPITYMFGGL